MIIEALKFYSDGGVFMHPVLLFGLGTLVLSLIQLAVPLAGLNRIVITGSLMTLFLSVIGLTLGLIESFEAVANAPPDMKTQMLCAGAAISLNPLRLGVVMLILHLVFASSASVIVATRQASAQT